MYLQVVRALLTAGLVFVLGGCGASEEQRAKNVILFIGDGTGLPTINASSIYGYGKPQQLYVQQMPHIGLSETSAASTWVTDSAAGMTAIMTGQKTHNGVVSLSDETVRGKKDGKVLKTLLEYAEERGLATGVISNSTISDATPAACYAHSNDRAKHGYIFAQILKPQFGDGIDVVIGPGRDTILPQAEELGVDFDEGLPKLGYTYVADEEAMVKAAGETDRLIALYSSEDFDFALAVEKALNILTRNPKGFFLMVESNNHFEDAEKSLARLVAMDKVIRKTAERMEGTDTLILFTADHSYDLRLPTSAAPRTQEIVPHIVIDGHHTAEEVLVAAQGPGSEKVKGMFPNTQIFHIMKDAYGW